MDRTMTIELRHCVYCRWVKRECDVVIAPRPNFKEGGGFTVKCKVCGAEGSFEKTSEEAADTWNAHTAFVVQALDTTKNMTALVALTENWKQRALASAAFADDLATLMTEVTDKIRTDAPAIAAKHKSAIGEVVEKTCKTCDGVKMIVRSEDNDCWVPAKPEDAHALKCPECNPY